MNFGSLLKCHHRFFYGKIRFLYLKRGPSFTHLGFYKNATHRSSIKRLFSPLSWEKTFFLLWETKFWSFLRRWHCGVLLEDYIQWRYDYLPVLYKKTFCCLLLDDLFALFDKLLFFQRKVPEFLALQWESFLHFSGRTFWSSTEGLLSFYWKRAALLWKGLFDVYDMTFWISVKRPSSMGRT